MAPSSTTRISARIPSGFTRPADALLVAVIASGRVGPAVAWAVRRSLSVVWSLLTAGLVDELILMIEPVTLGGGKTLFPDRRGGAQVRPDLGPDCCYGCPGLSLPAGSLSHRPERAPHLDGVFHGPDELLRGLGQLVPSRRRAAGPPAGVDHRDGISDEAAIPIEGLALSRVWTSYCNNEARGRPSMPAP
jgi:RibD C-terminal domain